MDSISISKISTKGQIVLPKKIRNKFQKDEDVVFIEKDGEIILKKSSEVLEDLSYLEFQKNTFKELEEYEKNPQGYESMNSKDFMIFLKNKIK